MAQVTRQDDSGPEAFRPVVRTAPTGNLGLWAFGGFLLLGGLLLFNSLESRRMQGSLPTTAETLPVGSRIEAPPPLVIPYGATEAAPAFPQPEIGSVRTPLQPPLPAPERVVTRVVEVPTYLPSPAMQAPQPIVAFDATGAPPPSPEDAAQALDAGERVLAARLANPSLTVPKGTVIPAVLESALDSTRSGAIRALVSRDMMGFDGTRVLIPRGSRLYGEYGADLNYGQNRALIRWTRLLRPDGVVINLDSPAADPLGRAGVKGRVNTHFLARFGEAILHSVLDIGVGLATRSVTDDAVILALPGSTQNVAGRQPSQVRPTLTVRQGTSVSVFVARDLDFSSVES